MLEYQNNSTYVSELVNAHANRSVTDTLMMGITKENLYYNPN
jgi:hypothetical protein